MSSHMTLSIIILISGEMICSNFASSHRYNRSEHQRMVTCMEYQNLIIYSSCASFSTLMFGYWMQQNKMLKDCYKELLKYDPLNVEYRIKNTLYVSGYNIARLGLCASLIFPVATVFNSVQYYRYLPT